MKEEQYGVIMWREITEKVILLGEVTTSVFKILQNVLNFRI